MELPHPIAELRQSGLGGVIGWKRGEVVKIATYNRMRHISTDELPAAARQQLARLREDFFAILDADEEPRPRQRRTRCSRLRKKTNTGPDPP